MGVTPGKRPGYRYGYARLDLGEFVHLTEPAFSQLYLCKAISALLAPWGFYAEKM